MTTKPTSPPLQLNLRAQGLWEARAVGESKRSFSKRAPTPTAQITQCATDIDQIKREQANQNSLLTTLVVTVSNLEEDNYELKVEISDLRRKLANAPKARSHRMITRSSLKGNNGRGIANCFRKLNK